MLENVPAAVGRALGGIRPGLEKICYAKLDAPETMLISSEAFADGQPIPARFTDDGAKASPPLAIGALPPGVRTLALIVEDADSPTPSPLCHALVWNIAPDHLRFDEADLNLDAMPTARREAVFGKNSFMSSGWLPPDPPTGHGAHRYAFQVYALDKVVDLAEGSGRGAVLDAIEGHVIAKALLVGTYERQ